MTNLLATIAICIVTNTTTVDNAQPASDGSCDGDYGSGISCLVMHYASDAVPATERTETAEVVEIKTLKFKWEGKEYTAKKNRVISTSVRKWKKQETWEEAK